MPEKKSTLLAYQDALVDLLSSSLSQDEVLATLKTDARFEAYREYVDQFDVDMVAVACELLAKWAKRKAD